MSRFQHVPGRRSKPAPPPGFGGSFDLLLVVIVVVAVWLRTPVGGLADRTLAWITGSEAEVAALTSYFVTGPPPEVIALVETVTLPDVIEPVAEGQFPEPYRTAARLVLGKRALPEPATAKLAERALTPGTEPGDAVVLALDAFYKGDAEAALEAFAIGEAQRLRAVSRAISAGEPSPETYASHRRYLPNDDARQADRIVSGVLALATALDLAWPVDASFRVSSDFGDRIHPVTGKRKLHNGIDLATPSGTELRSAQRGTVAVSAYDGANGNYVIVDHGNGVRTAYCHLSERLVRQGDVVSRQQVLGKTGNTGRSTGPHLHFVVKLGGTPIDPARFRRTPGS